LTWKDLSKSGWTKFFIWTTMKSWQTTDRRNFFFVKIGFSSIKSPNSSRKSIKFYFEIKKSVKVGEALLESGHGTLMDRAFLTTGSMSVSFSPSNVDNNFNILGERNYFLILMRVFMRVFC
jgi:hypothetical protein